MQDQLRNLSATNRDSPARFVGGAPQSVLQQLREDIRESGINYVLVVFAFGNLHPEHSMRSLELFASEVMPALKAEFG